MPAAPPHFSPWQSASLAADSVWAPTSLSLIAYPLELWNLVFRLFFTLLFWLSFLDLAIWNLGHFLASWTPGLLNLLSWCIPQSFQWGLSSFHLVNRYSLCYDLDAGGSGKEMINQTMLQMVLFPIFLCLLLNTTPQPWSCLACSTPTSEYRGTIYNYVILGCHYDESPPA